MEKSKVIILGAGFSSLSAGAYLAKAGYDVTIIEKNKEVGGRARQLIKDGFTFDIGPTFYWMPDVFEQFFADFGKRVADYYTLKRLDPGYEIYFNSGESIKIHADFKAIQASFETFEKGSGAELEKFINKAEDNYSIAIQDLVYKPGESIFEIISWKTFIRLGEFFSTIKGQVGKFVKSSKLRKVLEFPVLFLGAKPGNTPAFYNFMNYADLKLGTWHPVGGMYSVVTGISKMVKDLGVEIKTNVSAIEIKTEGKKVIGVQTNEGSIPCDILISGADYHHTESLLPPVHRQYSESFWRKKTFAPSALLFYAAFDKKIRSVSHHTLFFDSDFEIHAETIYDSPSWPEAPLFYASFPSITDKIVAPENKEAGIFLIPIAPDLEDTPAIREKYWNIILERLETLTGQEIKPFVLFKESYCVNDFKKDYNSYKGNAYGLANTLFQTHVLRPRLKSNKLENLYFTGQLTLPGPGVPPSLISGKIVSSLILKYHGI
jgi:phytoene desaturase